MLREKTRYTHYGQQPGRCRISVTPRDGSILAIGAFRLPPLGLGYSAFIVTSSQSALEAPTPCACRMDRPASLHCPSIPDIDTLLICDAQSTIVPDALLFALSSNIICRLVRTGFGSTNIPTRLKPLACACHLFVPAHALLQLSRFSDLVYF